MRIPCLIILFILFSNNCLPQKTTQIIHIDKLPPGGVLLDKGWKYQEGDNPAYADRNFDDNNWKSIDPTKDVHDIPPLWKNKIVWFRIHFAVNSEFIGRLAMMIQQSGASEMYLNGKLIDSFGIVSTNADEIKAYNPLGKPVSFPVSDTTEQVLALRYALQRALHYNTYFISENKGLHILVNTTENAIDQYQQTLVYDQKSIVFKIAIFLILAVLYFAFYLFYPSQKANLYFAVYAFILIVSFSLFSYLNAQHYLQHWFLIKNILLVIQVVAFLSLFTAIYRLLDQKMDWVYYSVFSLGIISIPFAILFYGWGWYVFGLLFTNSINVFITYIALKAVRNKKPGAWIISTGGLAYLIFWSLFTLQWNGLITFQADTFTLAFLSIPVAVSIYLGYDFALTNRSLQQKLTEVESLSYEKQQILTDQKETLEQQVKVRTSALNQSLEELKATQAQLIQSEKMASLGELTAGIAHEIQNPLNFVNNFSDVNKELIEELNAERRKPKAVRDEQLENEILNDLKENEEKINHHGKRADAIVKGMLQHSRQSSGQKEPTDINAMCDEYLRLSYHGMRARDKEFNAEIKTDFDDKIGKINIIPQDIGRVLLNLFNNAFYAVNEQKIKNPDLYEPTVLVTTKKSDNHVIITVSDNGNGIPKNIIDKIFQPFFTTKPAGSGTGLGLSLSYDIIKAHGGEIKVKSKKGEGRPDEPVGPGSEFIIQLPI